MSHGRELFVVAGEHRTAEQARAGLVGSASTQGHHSPETDFVFSRMSAEGTSPDIEVLRKVARAMVAGANEPDNPQVPAGYTYLGQFVDHDLTLDLNPAPLEGPVTNLDLVQGRSPSLDLDSMYGNGPRDPRDDRFYADDRASFVLGTTNAISVGPSDAGTAANVSGYDLPRVGNGASKSVRQKAQIPDHRNDENLVVAQTHLSFMRFHNAVVQRIVTGRRRHRHVFEEARETVVKHYQWMLRHDFLPRILDAAVLEDVFTNGRRFFEPDDHDRSSSMPLEFSVAAYRLGHSMVRARYDWNRIFGSTPTGPGAGRSASLGLLFIFSGTSGTFNPGAATPDDGIFERLPSNWLVDWRRFYDFAGSGHPELAPPAGVNHAMAIDTFVADPLKNLPLGSFGGTSTPPDPDLLNLAFRNLRRAAVLQLASGQQLADQLGVARLTDEQIIRGKDAEGSGVNLSDLSHDEALALTTNTPLWFYILREAELNDGKLAGVGARIVAEVFHRAMEASRHSIVRDPSWRPSMGPDCQTFRMVDLLLAAFGPAVSDLAPLGDSAPAAAPVDVTGAPVAAS